MTLNLTWQEVALRLLLASIASFLIGFNRDENGQPAGLRTTMLVCLAATLAMLQTNLLVPMAGKTVSSFIQLDAMRLPLGILTGIGFIGAGAIVRYDSHVHGVTTAATLWFITVIGILFGSGAIKLGIAGTLLGLFVLLVLRKMELYVPRAHSGALHLTFEGVAPSEEEVRARILTPDCSIEEWIAEYSPANTLSYVRAVVRWHAASHHHGPDTPTHLSELRKAQGIIRFRWEQ
jgi:putative Mg2+ transporter-C (MgtC) family protein